MCKKAYSKFNLLRAFRALEQIEADLDAARIQTAALAALIAPATKMFQFDDGANAFELSSPILLQHLRNQINIDHGPVHCRGPVCLIDPQLEASNLGERYLDITTSHLS
ncbi:unnamed protein product [Onchocerca flexuosa]|uniref:NR LBD domain-containing protein n=1 Tax=Onchocerca flexuosa TaxID=387005 RepID=A0A183HYX7_9BILA|nr:unnamed protein product [Onchocerca flexuosa]